MLASTPLRLNIRCFVRHDANFPDVVGPQAERQHIADDLAAFPDLHFEIEQLIAEGDLVAARYLVQGTHRGEFLGIPGTGRQVTIQAVESYRLAGGKLAEHWVVMLSRQSLLELAGWSELPIAVARLGRYAGCPRYAALDGVRSKGVAWGGRWSKEVRQHGFLVDRRAG